ncbi:MAG TPA: amidohydrolase [Blastocatellia bacterium]|nr:amidohydrolase [Blastocatellia bacterium]HMX25809.1 amidohydrolase [Blastocatellia bacterium]HMY72976.1 amidohydrolase [Blastocatellia bacterium]HMZ18240.1 amidohydrolase [Blastocatellia bacterium]HNG33094.1 amidohydrolase [Blastocatellia bacterium]
MQIIDTHQHLWDLDKLPYSWTTNNQTFNRSFRLEDYYTATAGVDVIKTVHVEADIDETHILDETRYILSLAERDDNPITGVVAGCRPEYDNFREYIEQIVGHPNLKGVRRILHVVPDEISTTTTFVENVRSLEEFDLSFDLCVLARQLPLAINLVKQCPNVRFILDHCGNPDIKNQAFDEWRAGLKELAAYSNVIACKISGIVVNTDIPHWTVEDLRPAVEGVIEIFGWDRVMFGSDWPVCTLAASLKNWLDALTALTLNAGEEHLEKLFRYNAERVYRLSQT